MSVFKPSLLQYVLGADLSPPPLYQHCFFPHRRPLHHVDHSFFWHKCFPEHATQKKSSDLLNNKASKLTPLEKQELALADKFSSPDVYINGENDTCWHPWIDILELKPLRFETRTRTFVTVLRSKEDTWLGKHRHRGSVTAVTLKGEWNYKEYDWVAKPGDYVVENPGTIHTLHMGKGAEVVFTITGSLEYFHDDDSLKNAMDIFSYAQLYYYHCKKQGLKPNDGLWF